MLAVAGGSWVAVFSLAMLAAALGWLSAWLAARTGTSTASIVRKIDALLPQTQCGQCGYPGCLPYSEAIAAGEAINKCAPGGQKTIDALAELLGTGTLAPVAGNPAEPPAQVVRIREEECIGCNKCLAACPVDAILGAPRHVYTIIADECTGCELCVPVCPVDCIELTPRSTGLAGVSLHRDEPRPQWPVPDEPPGRIPLLQVGPHPAFPPLERPPGKPSAGPVTPCIRCNHCASVCPVQLLPQQLYAHLGTDDREEAGHQRLLDCIECGACSKACPSEIPLADLFRQARTDFIREREMQQRADHSRHRFEFRQSRMAAAQEAREKKRAERLQGLASAVGRRDVGSSWRSIADNAGASRRDVLADEQPAASEEVTGRS